MRPRTLPAIRAAALRAKWSNETHRSTTDSDARLYRKGRNREARLCDRGHALMGHRHGLVVDGLVSRATGEAERLAAEVMLMRRLRRGRRITLGVDKAYDAVGFLATCTDFRVTPHVARNTSGRRSNVPDAIAGTDGYATSRKARKRIEEVFAWVKLIAGYDRTRHRRLDRVGWQFILALAACSLIRIPKLPAAPA